MGVALTLAFIMALCSRQILAKLVGEVKMMMTYCSCWTDKIARQMIKVALNISDKLSYHKLFKNVINMLKVCRKNHSKSILILNFRDQGC